MAVDRPNLLLIMTDQQRWDALGCVSRWIQTPNLDRLAAEGVRFNQCVTTSPVCLPARFSLALGQYPHNTGIWRNGYYTLDPDCPTWMAAIRDAGYRTSLFGKTHLHADRDGADLRDKEHLLHAYGLDDVNETPGPRGCASMASHMTAHWQEQGLLSAFQTDYQKRFATQPTMVRPTPLGAEAYYDTYVGQQAQAYLETYRRDEPWFCWVSFPGPHEPWDTPEPWASLHDPADAPAPRPAPTALADDRPRGWLDERLAREQRTFEPEQARQLWANYAGEIALIDDQIGQLLQTLEARGELDRTVIVFTSDHGEHSGDAGLVYKQTFLDPAVRVPLIVRAPQYPQRGVVSDALVEWIDVGPTLAELAGVTLEYQQFGRSLTPVLSGSTQTHRDESISELHGELMVMTEQWKAMFSRRGELYSLFNRLRDPLESTNLAGLREHAQTTADLTARALGRMLKTQLYQNPARDRKPLHV